MGVFDDLITIGKDDEILFNKWVEWDHFFVPNKPDWLRQILRNILAMFNHCMKCSALDGCYLVSRNTPDQPLHENCDCKKKGISKLLVNNRAKAECDIRKFTEYVFKNTYDSKGKNLIFFDLGFNVNDSEYLRDELCKQALEQYLIGNYVLKNLDKRGQRLAIPIKLNNTSFYSGWMLCPEGKIKNNTPLEDG